MPDPTPDPQEEMAAVLLKSLPALLSLAHKDPRFRDIIAAYCAKKMPELHKKNGLDLHLVKEMKGILDGMMVDRMGRRFLFADCKLAATTLRIKLFRALEYIFDYDPEAAKYRDIIDATELQNIKEKDSNGQSLGIALVFVRDVNSPSIVAKKIEREVDLVRQETNWRKALAEFMDSQEPGVHISDIKITDEDIEGIHQLFGTMDGEYQLLLVTNSEIKIVRTK